MEELVDCMVLYEGNLFVRSHTEEGYKNHIKINVAVFELIFPFFALIFPNVFGNTRHCEMSQYIISEINLSRHYFYLCMWITIQFKFVPCLEGNSISIPWL